MADKIEVPERVLARIWEEQAFFPDCLYTTAGQPVQVIRPGVLNRDAGPDFAGALIRIGDQTVEGDVELHLRVHDWQAHGHDADPHYNRTVLHVVLWPPERPTTDATMLRKANGDRLPTVFVHHVLNAALPELLERFQERDDTRRAKRRRCRAELDQLPTARLLATLEALGHERLTARAQRFQDDFLGQAAALTDAAFEQAVYEALCEGLGYAANKTPFRELARRLPLAVIMRHLPAGPGEVPGDHLDWIQAMLFGVSGLLPESGAAESDAETAAYLDRLHSLWDMLRPTLDLEPLPPESWQFFRLRPANFPTRRVAALSHLVLEYTVQPVFAHYLELFGFCRRHPGEERKQIRVFEDTLHLALPAYWQTRYRFGPPAKQRPDRRFLGQSRIRDILISAVFPAYACYAQVRGLRDLTDEILTLYRQFPSPVWDHGTTTLLNDILGDRDVPPRTVKTAAIYQGLLHLSKTSCALPSCADCRLLQTLDAL